MAQAAIETGSRKTQHYRPDSSAIPPGWTTNPSDPKRRVVLALLATMGFLTAGYLALYETNVISTVWEPFFGQGSKVILDSKLSRWFPVPDAALGAAAYFVDALLQFAGGEDRWKSHPWFVLLNGATSIGLGVAAILLMIVQPIAYGTYCSLCLFSAFISINLVGPTLEECLAALQFLGRKYTEPTKRQKEKEAEQTGEPEHPAAENRWDATGIQLRHLVGVIIGLWLMASPWAIGFAEYARADMRITGPIIVVLSVLAIWPGTRWFARLNAFAGGWLMIGPILLQAPHLLLFPTIMLGAVLVALAVFPGNAAPHIGGGWIGILGPGSDVP
ncbi:MAG: vitamin K epoxide reductase family protein [Nitrolancea sp.]